MLLYGGMDSCEPIWVSWSLLQKRWDKETICVGLRYCKLILYFFTFCLLFPLIFFIILFSIWKRVLNYQFSQKTALCYFARSSLNYLELCMCLWTHSVFWWQPTQIIISSLWIVTFKVSGHNNWRGFTTTSSLTQSAILEIFCEWEFHGTCLVTHWIGTSLLLLPRCSCFSPVYWRAQIYSRTLLMMSKNYM